MTADLLLSLVCQWLNSLGYKAIKAPSDNPAPSGKYISVSLGSVRQVGDVLVPGPVPDDYEGDPKYKAFMQVASVQLYEVEGDGEWLRSIRNQLQLDDIDDFIANHVTPETGKDTGFSIWEIGEIVDNSSQDRAYWIRQRTMSFDAQFYDYIAHTSAPIKTVEFSIETNNSL